MKKSQSTPSRTSIKNLSEGLKHINKISSIKCDKDSSSTSPNSKTIGTEGLKRSTDCLKPTRYALVSRWNPSGYYKKLEESPTGSLLLYADFEELEKRYIALLSDVRGLNFMGRLSDA